MSITSPIHYILSVTTFVLFMVFEADSQNARSCFSFIHTDEKSPRDLEEKCFKMTNSKLNNLYQGISLHVMTLAETKPSSCSFEDIKLDTIQRYIISNETRQRRLCRTKAIFSIDKTKCEDKLRHLQFYCDEFIQKNKSIYFENCATVNCSEEKLENKDSLSEAQILSQFPEPTASNSGRFFAYDIPTSHCVMRQCKLDNCSTDQIKTSSTTKPANKPKETENKECMLFAIGSGGGGLLTGILSTSIMCFLLNKYKRNYRNVGAVSFSRRNVHLMSETERKLSIHSKEEETVYHDISDVPGPSKVRAIQHGVSNLMTDDSPEQRYSESPKSSTSAYENGSISSQLSSKSAPIKSKDDSLGRERPQFYHTLARDYKVKSGRLVISTGKQIDVTDVTATDNYSKTEKHSTSEGKQYSAYESPIGQRHVSFSQKVQLDSTDLADDTVESLVETKDVSESLSGVYHSLQEEKGGLEEKLPIETEIKVDQDKRSSNGTSSQKEYYVITAKASEQESSSSES